MPTSIPGKLALVRTKRSDSGLTLIEILVALTIVGVIMALGAGSIRRAFDVDLKKSANRLSANLRYLSNKAVIDQVYLRIIYNIDEGSYRVEQTTDPFVISTEESEEDADKKEAEEASDETEDGEGKSQKSSEGGFAAVESTLLKPTKLPKGVGFKDVAVSYLEDKRENGEIATYFFPDGYATPTLINLKNEEDDAHYSIELMALSGRVKVTDEYKESLSKEDKK